MYFVIFLFKRWIALTMRQICKQSISTNNHADSSTDLTHFLQNVTCTFKSVWRWITISREYIYLRGLELNNISLITLELKKNKEKEKKTEKKRETEGERNRKRNSEGDKEINENETRLTKNRRI